MNWLTRPTQQTRHPFDQLFEDMLDGFGLATRPAEWAGREMGAFSPRMDIKETENAYELTAELPGMAEKDVDVTLDNNVLTISGEKKTEHSEGSDTLYRMERSYGSFQRRFTLPTEVDTDKVDAAFKHGVLTVTVPKTAPAKDKLRKIEVKS